MRLLGAEDITRLLPIERAIGLMERAFRIISEGSASLAHRQALPLPRGIGLLMGAAHPGLGLGCKLVANAPGNPALGLPVSNGLVLLLDDETGEPLALLDGSRLTALRTAALSGCAIDRLARPDAATALLVGCGTEAAAQAEAMTAVRPLQELRVLGRDPGRARAFVERLQQKLTVPVRLFTDRVAALEGVDLVTSATNSLEPVVPGAHVPAGCHVSGIGSFRPDMREFDRDLLEKSVIFVESRTSALAEAGELIDAYDAGLTHPEQWGELGEVIAGQREGRTDPEQVTYFKSVGHSVFDLVTARALYDAALADGAGVHWTP